MQVDRTEPKVWSTGRGVHVETLQKHSAEFTKDFLLGFTINPKNMATNVIDSLHSH